MAVSVLTAGVVAVPMFEGIAAVGGLVGRKMSPPAYPFWLPGFIWLWPAAAAVTYTVVQELLLRRERYQRMLFSIEITIIELAILCGVLSNIPMVVGLFFLEVDRGIGRAVIMAAGVLAGSTVFFGILAAPTTAAACLLRYRMEHAEITKALRLYAAGLAGLGLFLCGVSYASFVVVGGEPPGGDAPTFVTTVLLASLLGPIGLFAAGLGDLVTWPKLQEHTTEC